MTLSLSAISQLLSLAFCEVGTENTKPSLNKSIFKKNRWHDALILKVLHGRASYI